MAWKFKLWRSAGAAAALSLAACGGEGGENGAHGSQTGEAGESGASAPTSTVAPASSGGEQGEAGVATAYSGVSGDQRTALRLQHLKGFLLVSALVAASDPPAASALVGQGVLEVYEPAIAEFGALDAAPLRAAAASADASAAQMRQRLRDGEAAINAAREGLDIDYADLAARMTDLSAGLYQNVVQPDFVDPIEYQHSLGAALAARDALNAGRSQLQARDPRAYREAMAEIDRLIALWPAPSATKSPASYRDVLAQSSRVRLALSPFL
ncbi:MAG: hypothetical protein ABL864_04990 [Terricaulis sp.]